MARDLVGEGGSGWGRCKVYLIANTEAGQQIGAASVCLESGNATRKATAVVYFNGPQLDEMIAILEAARARLAAANRIVVGSS